MKPISITEYIFDKIVFFHNADTRQNIFDYNNLHNIGNKGLVKHHHNYVNFKDMDGGGNIYEIKLDNGSTYEFYIDEIIPDTNNLRRICFMSNSFSYDCLCVLFGSKKSGDSLMRIESVISSNECVKCTDKTNNLKIKHADVLIQILLKILKTNSKFSHIKKLELSDTSKKSCYNIGIELIYLRTITKGIPYYAKFGFRPNKEIDYDVFKHNKNNFKLNKTISNDDLLKIIIRNKLDKNTFNTYEKYIKTYILNNKNINPVLFFTEIIDIIDISIGKKEIGKRINNIFIGNKIIKNKNDMIGICDFLNSICKDVYLYLDYKDYTNRIWTMNI